MTAIPIWTFIIIFGVGFVFGHFVANLKNKKRQKFEAEKKEFDEKRAKLLAKLREDKKTARPL